MDIPSPPQAIVAVAAFVRERLSEVSDTIGPLLARRESDQVLAARSGDPRVVGAARQLVTVIVSAAGPLAPNAYARARLIRQMHATGLLTADEARQAELALESESPAPRRPAPGRGSGSGGGSGGPSRRVVDENGADVTGAPG